MATFASAGGTPLMAIANASWNFQPTSSYAASCCTCYHPASCAFVTSASLPTASAHICCPCACACCTPHRNLLLHLSQPSNRSGPARTAAERCRLSSVSGPRKSRSALLQLRATPQHDNQPSFDNSSPAPARTAHLCL